MDGILVVDKPADWTSHDVVDKVRRLARTRRVGHAGTLDPMATGVLVLGVNRATRLLGHLTLTRKAYDATIRLGQATTTDDAQGEVISAAPAAHLDDDAIARAIQALTGDIMQVPATISAIKVDGARAYARARAGETVELAARPVTVYAFDVHATRLDGELLDLDVSVDCSSGTYVRALARDLGAALGVGGHLTALRRTAVGPYRLADARTIPDLERVAADGPLPLLPLGQAAAAAFPRRDVTAAEARTVVHGGFLAADRAADGPVAVFGPDGAFLALVADSGGRAKPIAVFAPAVEQSAPAAGQSAEAGSIAP
jgi:tRNA pseudouridine55 synthase